MSQVLFSFIGTGILVFLILLFNYMISHDPEAYPFPPENDAERKAGPPNWWKPNPVDVLLLSFVRNLGRKFPVFLQIGQPNRVEAAFNRVCPMPFLCFKEYTATGMQCAHVTTDYWIIGHSDHV